MARDGGPLRAGDRVTIRPEFQDAGDTDFAWYAADDEQQGRVTIITTIPNMVIPRTEVMQSYMLERA